MWLFWIVAGALAALTAALIVARATGAAKQAAAGLEDPSLPVYRRQLAEIDDLATRGLLGDEERKAAKAEAGRRLLTAADHAAAPEVAGGKAARLIIVGGIGAAVVAALLLYVGLGSPGNPDQPYRARVAAWRKDPTHLQPAEMAAVLRLMTAQRPNEAEGFEYLGRAELQAGDPIAAVGALRKATALQPARADLFVLMGEAMLAAAGEDKTPADARAAFERALQLHPGDVPARYFLARMQLLSGDKAGGIAAFKGLEADLPPGDQRRAMLETDMAQLAGAPAPVAGQANAIDAQAAAAAQAGAGGATGPEQAAFIKSMVGRLAARLAAAPDDVDGWARLVRAYKVLGDKPALSAALDKARRQFAGRPQDLARIEAEAR